MNDCLKLFHNYCRHFLADQVKNVCCTIMSCPLVITKDVIFISYYNMDDTTIFLKGFLFKI